MPVLPSRFGARAAGGSPPRMSGGYSRLVVQVVGAREDASGLVGAAFVMVMIDASQGSATAVEQGWCLVLRSRHGVVGVGAGRDGVRLLCSKEGALDWSNGGCEGTQVSLCMILQLEAETRCFQSQLEAAGQREGAHGHRGEEREREMKWK